MDIETLVNVTARAWSLPILARLHDGTPGRQAPLLTATGAGRTAFAQSVEHLIQLGLVERNPGHGHPLRPEFRLTVRGQEAGAVASRVLRAAEPDHLDLVRRSWTLPVLTTLDKPTPFVGIKRRLGTITDRSLSLALQGMEARDWVLRTVDDAERPPRPLYAAINSGAVLGDVARAAVSL